MGSHGGATADGQRKIIESYGITEEFVGVPIRASMDVVTIGHTEAGFPVFLDQQARAADHIAVFGRIKPHTNFQGPVESGFLKMMMIGLGKHEGARAYHRILLEHPYEPVVRAVARIMLAQAPIRFGLAIVENAYEQTALVEAVPPERFEEREVELLKLARQWMARLPLREADLLIVDEIGKNISGSGMDTNVVGRKRGFGGDPAVMANQPRMRFIFVRGLSAKTHGNASGIGLADFTTTRLVQAMDYRATMINCLTAGFPGGANIPVHFESDREVLDAALKIIGTREPEQARILHIRNTLALDEMHVSEPALAEINDQARYDVLSEPQPMRFDEHGNLIVRESAFGERNQTGAAAVQESWH
jgi:Lactate racemase N-terminal domain